MQIVQLDDLVRTVLFFLRADAPTRVALEIVGPEALSLDEVLATYRRWLGFGRPRFVSVPRWAEATAFRIGDLIGRLGWRPPLRSTTRAEIGRGATGDPGPWQRLTGITPRTLGAALAAEPASVQERWFARLYFLKPVVLATLSLFWIVSGLISLGPGWEEGRRPDRAGGALPLLRWPRRRRHRRSADRRWRRDPAHGEDRAHSQAWRSPSAIFASPRCC